MHHLLIYLGVFLLHLTNGIYLEIQHVIMFTVDACLPFPWIGRVSDGH